MKNLLDELHELDKEEFEVSKDFSKKVVSKINKDKKIVVLKRVTSVAMVACVAAFAVFLSNRLGLFDRISSIATNSASMSAAEETMSLNATQGELITENKTEETLVTESSVVERYNTTNETEQFKSINSAPEMLEEPIATYDSVEEAVPQKTYSKQMTLEEYINDIHKALYDNNINNSIISDTEIEIESDDINAIYDIIEKYTDANLDLSDNKIILRIK